MKRELSSDLELNKKPRLDPDESLLEFQKEAILLQMKEYKRKFIGCTQSINQLNSRIEDLEKENIQLKSNGCEKSDSKDLEISNLGQKIQELKQKLQDYELQIDKLNKKIDRSNLKLRNSGEVAMEIDQSQQIQSQQQDIPTEGLEEIQELKYQIQCRNDDIQKMEKEISKLSLMLKQNQVDYKQMKQSFDRRKDYELELKELINESQLKLENDQLVGQLQTLKQNQREYQQLVKDEEEKKRKVLEQDLKKSNQELVRLRTNRDQLAKNIEQMKLKTQDSEVVHLKTLVDARKQKIDYLESELSRLKACVAGDIGELGLLKFFETSNENPYKKLKSELELANMKLKKFENNDTTNLEELKRLQDLIEKYTTLYGEISNDSLNSDLILEQTRAELVLLQTKLEQKEKSEQRLMQELETLGGAWSTLEQQYTSSTPSMDENKFLMEKQKLEQKLMSYQKQNSSFNNTYKAQKSQFEKQLEQIRKLEELEKNHLVQIVQNVNSKQWIEWLPIFNQSYTLKQRAVKI